MVRQFDLTGDEPRPARKKPPQQKKRGRPKNALDGWIVLDKPAGLTSTQALGAVKRLFAPEKAGHAGTLDPLATGLLPLAFGDATKTVPYVVDGEKRYQFTVRWGAQTDTDDAEGSTIATSDVRPSRPAVEAALPAFVGDIEQVPPQYSAVKINGQRAYDLAREGTAVEIKPRIVSITRLAVIDDPPDGDDTITLEAECGKGTYVRSLARDLAKALGTEGHVIALRRTRVGPFGEDHMVTLDELRAEAAEDVQATIEKHLRPPVSGLASVPEWQVDKVAASRLRRGQATLMRPLPGSADEGAEFCAVSGLEPVALCRAQHGELHPVRVFRAPRRRITVVPAPPPEPT